MANDKVHVFPCRQWLDADSGDRSVLRVLTCNTNQVGGARPPRVRLRAAFQIDARSFRAGVSRRAGRLARLAQASVASLDE